MDNYLALQQLLVGHHFQADQEVQAHQVALQFQSLDTTLQILQAALPHPVDLVRLLFLKRAGQTAGLFHMPDATF